MGKRARKSKLPGCVYQKRRRYYWKVKLPGESDIKAARKAGVEVRTFTRINSI